MHKFDKGKKFINKENAFNSLRDVTAVLDKHNIFYCLIFGTLLGAIREKDFISYDNDMDLAVFWKDREKILNLLPTELSSFVKQDLPYQHDINLIRDEEKLELWLFEDIGDKYIYDPTRCGNIKYDKSYFDKYEVIDFKGIPVKVPYNSTEFLTVTYGPTWTIPNKNGGYILR